MSFGIEFLQEFQWFKKLYQTFEIMFHSISKHLEVGYIKTNSAAPPFSTRLLGVLKSDETLSHV